MKGKLYGIGVGPGDSELMTVKAARIVGEADVIITPKTEKKDGSVALNIAKPYIQEHTEIVPVVLPPILVASFPICKYPFDIDKCEPIINIKFPFHSIFTQKTPCILYAGGVC